MRKRLAVLLLAPLLAPATAFAHVGQDHGLPFVAGISHPLGGADHLVAMLAVGLAAACIGGQAMLVVPMAFMAGLLGGGILGAAGVPLPLVEPMILLSVLILGLGVAFAQVPKLPLTMVIVAVFGLFHGHAHGAEGPAGLLLPYAAGFLLASAGLHLAGIALGRFLPTIALRGLGALAAVSGVFMATAG